MTAERGAPAALSLFRFTLALMVMAIHLSGATPLQTGRVAVEGFFCISGFLITMVASGRYAGRPLNFLTNRFLRIYPTYWLCLGIALAIVTFVPVSTALHPSLYAPATTPDLLANLAIFGLTQDTPSRLLPAAWSLHTELWFYLVIGLVTARRPKTTFVLLGLSLVFSGLIVQGFVPLPFYGTPLGNAFAFFLGSALWQNRHALKPPTASYVALAGFALFELLAWLPQQVVSDRIVYLSAPTAGLFLFGLWNTPVDRFLNAPLCAFAGRLAYPVFLLHWPLGALTWKLTGIAPGWLLFALGGSATLVTSALVLVAFEAPLETVRARIRRPAYPLEREHVSKSWQKMNLAKQVV